MKKYFAVVLIFCIMVSGCVQEKACEEKWKCSDWSDCINGFRTRSCKDINACGTEKTKPVERVSCEPKSGVQFKAGMWSMFRISSGTKPGFVRYEAIGPVTIHGKKYAGIEMTVMSDTMETVYEWLYPLSVLGMPSWEMNPEYTVVKALRPLTAVKCSKNEVYPHQGYVSKEETKKYIGSVLSGEFLGTEEYKINGNKTIQVEKYRIKNKEYWLSYDVPFLPLAKLIEKTQSGEKTTELVDFGMSGGRGDITDKELDSFCLE